jgi:NAD kinase
VFEKIVIVTRKTRLDELIERFNTHGQAKFYIEHAGGDFADYEDEHAAYASALQILRRSLDFGIGVQVIDRSLVPTFLFANTDLVVAIGQDGLVANVAKYAGAQPIVGINPDPKRFDGVLLPFTPDQSRRAVGRALEGAAKIREVALAEAFLQDGQRLLAFNDLYLGARSHVSARYRIRLGEVSEAQSSSGVIVSTEAGSTGWLSSVFNMAAGVNRFTGGAQAAPIRLKWEDPQLVFVVREPFLSRHSQAGLVAGRIAKRDELVLESQMPSGGVIFSDGVESDFVEFNSGSIAHVRVAAQRARLIRA